MGLYPPPLTSGAGSSDMIDVKETHDDRTGEKLLEVPLKGRPLLESALLNKGSAFSEPERDEFDLVGLLPAGVSTLEEQAARRYEEYQQKADGPGAVHLSPRPAGPQ